MLGLGSVRDREDEVPSSSLDKDRGIEGMGEQVQIHSNAISTLVR